jgi:lipoyl(octanoyl) transferase
MKIVADSVSAFVFRGTKFLLLRRVPAKGGFWQSVSGRLQKRELPEEAARRETEEETGLEVRRVVYIDYVNTFYQDGKVHLEPCFGVEVGPGRVRLSGEHDEFRWVGAAEALRLLRWAGNREAFRKLREEIR